MSRIAYYRVSDASQDIAAQRHALGGSFDKEFADEGVSGAVSATARPGFSNLLNYIREGDTLYVYAIDRLGRDALDVQTVIRALLDKGVTVDVKGLGPIGRGVGELVVAVLAQMADMERGRIRERCDAGRAVAKASLAATGRTHKGKTGLGRPEAGNRAAIVAWRKENAATIAATAAHFRISPATVTRYCGALGKIGL
ncbi:recombinase family protein [Sphingomonas sp. LB3N6]|uniref:recombinase family protein n=1 Tax=Sphingomonas fucosidasi TaxID=3096164 RepID=UPI002FC79661